MALIDAVPTPPSSLQSSETPPGSLPHTPPTSPCVHESPCTDIVGRLEQAVVKLTQASEEKVEATAKHQDMGFKPTSHAEAGKPKTRASKLEYKLVDEVYVPRSKATTVLTSPVKLGHNHVEVQNCGFVRAPRSGNEPGRACVCYSCSNR